MPLEDYRKKRKFSETPEPGPEVPKEAGPELRFCVQRHDATRLHYDFRLEVDGVLKSWAVPKGPTMDPSVKRLAMMVEDHPIAYGSFEGNIPAGNYGGGSVMLWDEGTYDVLLGVPAQAQIDRGDFKFSLHGKKLSGDFALVRMKGKKPNEWLLLKKKGPEADPTWDIANFDVSVSTGRTQDEIANDAEPEKTEESSMPSSVTPMKAQLSSKLPRGDDWLFELKLDGVRSICFLDEQGVRVQSRSGRMATKQYPELQRLKEVIRAKRVVLDGEITMLDENGRPDFGLLQPRMMASGERTIATLSTTKPVTLYLFDLLWVDGQDLRHVPLVDRKKRLQSILKPDDYIRFCEHTVGRGDELIAFAKEHGLEGAVAKQVSSTYVSGRSDCWRKIKLVSHQELVIGGFTAGDQSDGFGALLGGVYREGKLVCTGKVGTGFNDEMIKSLLPRLEKIETAKSPFTPVPKFPEKITWVEPKLVAEIKYLNWTRDWNLRAPVFLGLRNDVDPEQCVREEPEAVPAEEAVEKTSGPLLPKSGPESRTVEADGRELKLTNVSKVFYPEDGYTKRDLLNYYDGVAPFLLPHLKDRPLSLKRYPDGIGKPYFFQKNSTGRIAPWVKCEKISSGEDKEIEYVICNDRATLLYLVNLGCIDQNPWPSRVGSLENPDFVLIDLDPSDCPYFKIVEAAQLIRKKLELLELEGYPKTTGGDGMHLYIPLEPGYNYTQMRMFAEVLARWVAAERPDLFTLPRSVSARQKGTVYFDYLQNGEGKTVSAPYVTRAYPHAPVATPLKWTEVKKGLEPQQFHIGNALQRFEKVGDLFAPVLKKPQRLSSAMEKMKGLLAEAG